MTRAIGLESGYSWAIKNQISVSGRGFDIALDGLSLRLHLRLFPGSLQVSR